MTKPRVAKVKAPPGSVKTLRVAKKPAPPHKMKIQSDAGLVPPETLG